jgi:hypothetical protein
MTAVVARPAMAAPTILLPVIRRLREIVRGSTSHGGSSA